MAITWTNAPLRLFHGTTRSSAIAIVADGVRLRFAQPRTDSGRGFYATTNRAQAGEFAAKYGNRFGGEARALVEFTVDRDNLASLDSLTFVSGGKAAEDFWQLVEYCRAGGQGHARTGDATTFYDVVCGPVTKNWRTHNIHWSLDQISFHTANALALLNSPDRRSIIDL